MDFERTTTRADYLRDNRAHLCLIFTTGTMAIPPLILGGFAGYVATADLAGSFAKKAAVGAVAAAVAAFAAYLLLWGASILLLRRRSNRLHDQQPTLARPVRYIGDDEGLRWHSEDSSGRVRWHEFQRWADGGAALLLFRTTWSITPSRPPCWPPRHATR